jgi:predicted negative regulator of RcsB-dependent stress response
MKNIFLALAVLISFVWSFDASAKFVKTGQKKATLVGLKHSGRKPASTQKPKSAIYRSAVKKTTPKSSKTRLSARSKAKAKSAKLVKKPKSAKSGKLAQLKKAKNSKSAKLKKKSPRTISSAPKKKYSLRKRRPYLKY